MSKINKLSDIVFLEQIAYMMAWYSNFNLKLQDSDGKLSMQYKVWYQAFEHFDDDNFKSVVAMYCRDNVYPPSSPTSLLDFAKVKMVEFKSQEINKAWEELMNLIGIHGYKPYATVINGKLENVYPLNYALDKHENKLLKKLYNMMSVKIQAMTDFSRMEVLKDFSKIYADLLTQEANTLINQGELGLDDKKLLKEK